MISLVIECPQVMASIYFRDLWYWVSAEFFTRMSYSINLFHKVFVLTVMIFEKDAI